MSDTTLRARRDEWIDAVVFEFESLKTEALAAFDRIIGLDHVALDGSLCSRSNCEGRRSPA